MLILFLLLIKCRNLTYFLLDNYFTEISGGSWDTDFASILTWDMRMIFIGQTRNWAKTALLWSIALDQNHGPKVYAYLKSI
jgi:O-glycosyl hydrolase